MKIAEILVIVSIFVFSTSEAETISVTNAPFYMPEIILPAMPAREFSIVSYGARSGEKCTGALAAAMSACAQAGGGRVVVPSGIWLTGKVHLLSGRERAWH